MIVVIIKRNSIEIFHRKNSFSYFRTTKEYFRYCYWPEHCFWHPLLGTEQITFNFLPRKTKNFVNFSLAFMKKMQYFLLILPVKW